ncbi:DUF2621 domain-containing protein [Ornithinibacillus halophilus]|uniref:DUF2621 domain-containing protein n=1 Tax=Ornithinibacillus halophilus TaxID=930117 RepID=A0A1M5CH12_9BACI|nr:DUF2621 domain-containing protein [Ornithinibacillus halophilus]SHF53961.1 Protein of unknown function [Ornithinibacillus halophilus]
MSALGDYFIVFWGFLLIGLMAIGGYFMFRKFLKSIPKEDGKSDLDWEKHYLDRTRHMWRDEEKALLEELVSPVPELFRDVARQKIASKIGQVALQKKKNIITQDILIEGYIIATPKRDHKFLRKKLKEKNIDAQPYEELFKKSATDYSEGWEAKYNKSKKH